MQIHTIHLPHRTDRAARLQAIEAETPGVHFELELGSKCRRSWLGCTYSHLAIIFEARLRGDPLVIVAEDDIEFVPSFTVERLEAVITQADASEFDCLHGGTVSYADKIASWASPIVETDQYMSGHLNVYFARGYEKFLRMPFGNSIDFNPNPIGSREEMMLEMTERPKRGLVVPFLAIQRDDFSDNCGRVLRLADNWRDAEQTWVNATRGMHGNG